MRNFMRIVISMSMVAGLAGGAVADDKPAPAKGAPAVPAKKPDAKPAPVPPAPPPVKDEAHAMPTPSAEVAAAVKASTGTWKCNGQMFMPDGSAQPMKATMKTKFALDKFWAQTSFAETKKNGFKFESYRTFDGKKWHSLHVDNMGSQEVGWSDGPKDGKTVWESAGRSVMGESKARHYEEMVGKELKMWGEWSMDKGKTYVKGYEAVCKK